MSDRERGKIGQNGFPLTHALKIEVSQRPRETVRRKANTHTHIKTKDDKGFFLLLLFLPHPHTCITLTLHIAKKKHTAMSLNLDTLRLQIDSLDHKLIALLNERAQVSLDIGAAKKSAMDPQ